jgi:histidinol-phosphatase (PHP family)
VKAAGAAGLADYHVHSSFSDGTGTIDESVEAAVGLGLAEIGIVDHLVPATLDYPGYGLPHGMIEEYAVAVLDARARYRELRVLLGAEVDFTPQTTDEMEGLLARAPFDYVVGSVHFVDGFGFDEERTRHDERWRDVAGVYRRYYALLAEAAAWGRFDVVGHLELPKKWGHRPAADVSAAEAAALDAISAAGLAIELNTTGLDDAAGEIYPGSSLASRARERGIAIVLGSDAHEPAQVGRNFDRALAAAREAGFTSCLRLSDRREVPLP